MKVEIISDSRRLHKSANGLIELFLLSQNSSNNNVTSIFAPIASSSEMYTENSAGTLPRTYIKKSNQNNMGFKRVCAFFIFLTSF